MVSSVIQLKVRGERQQVKIQQCSYMTNGCIQRLFHRHHVCTFTNILEGNHLEKLLPQDTLEAWFFSLA